MCLFQLDRATQPSKLMRLIMNITGGTTAMDRICHHVRNGATRLGAGVSIVCVAASLCAFGAKAETIAGHDTGDNSELLTSLPGDNVKRVLYSYDLASLGAGDILVVDGEGELTNNNSVTAQLGAQLILGDSATATGGTELDEANQFGVTPGMHHGVRIKGSIKGFTAKSSRTFVNLVVWTNQTLVVEQDYGRVQIVQITP